MKKLVRNKIPDIIRKSNKQPIIRVLKEPEYRQALKQKIYEEVEEFFNAVDQKGRIEEMADIMEVLRGLCCSHAIFIDDVVHKAKVKREARGDFSKKIYLEGIDDGSNKLEDTTKKATDTSKTS